MPWRQERQGIQKRTVLNLRCVALLSTWRLSSQSIVELKFLRVDQGPEDGLEGLLPTILVRLKVGQGLRRLGTRRGAAEGGPEQLGDLLGIGPGRVFRQGVGAASGGGQAILQ